MLAFIGNFSQSFILALLIWPFMAFMLMLPVLIIQYRKYNKLRFWQSVGTYLFILYALGLVSFTLYPMPDNPALYCQIHHLEPQLVPFQFISDIIRDGSSAIMQVVMNVLFFLPLGVFLRILFGWRMRWSLIIGFATSLFIETAQLTGVFGIYPCSYRLFDVDDLIVNTIGAVVGYGLACFIPVRNIEKVQKDAVTLQPGLVRLIVSFIVDMIVSFLVTVVITLSAHLIFGREFGLGIRDFISVLSFYIFIFVVPYLNGGRSVGSYFTRLTFDNKPRRLARRTAYYLFRFLFLAALIFAPHGINLLIIFITFILWRKKKKLPYQYL